MSAYAVINPFLFTYNHPCHCFERSACFLFSFLYGAACITPTFLTLKIGVLAAATALHHQHPVWSLTAGFPEPGWSNFWAKRISKPLLVICVTSSMMAASPWSVYILIWWSCLCLLGTYCAFACVSFKLSYWGFKSGEDVTRLLSGVAGKKCKNSRWRDGCILFRKYYDSSEPFPQDPGYN